MPARAIQLENAVAKLLDLHKYLYFRVSHYRCDVCGAIRNRSAKGMPDFLCYSPFLVAVECKTGAGRLTKEQREVRDELEESGYIYLEVRNTVDKLLHFLEGINE